nr:MAG TPA: hypothetical protein [Caudoviricetes sp.]
MLMSLLIHPLLISLSFHDLHCHYPRYNKI